MSLKHPLSAFLLIISMFFNSARASGLDAIPMDVIKLPELEEAPKLELLKHYRLKAQAYKYEDKKQNKIKGMSKKFGPLELKFRVNPFRARRSSLKFNIDLIESYEIFSKSQNRGEFISSFKASEDHQIIDKNIKTGIKGFFNILSGKTSLNELAANTKDLLVNGIRE